jgi:hypothetical protein
MYLITPTKLSEEDNKKLIEICNYIYPYEITKLKFHMSNHDIVLIIDSKFNLTYIHYYELCVRYLIPEIGSKLEELDYSEFFDLMLYEDEKSNIITNLYNEIKDELKCFLK